VPNALGIERNAHGCGLTLGLGVTRFSTPDTAHRAEALSVLAVGVTDSRAAALVALLEPPEFRLHFASGLAQAQSLLEARRPRLLLVDAALPDAAALLRTSSDRFEVPSVVTCRPDTDRALLSELVAAGALNVVLSQDSVLGSSHELAEAQSIFRETLRDASTARLAARQLAAVTLRPLNRESTPSPRAPRVSRELPTLIAVGSATGGIDALCVLLAGLPEDAPGLVIAQHGSRAFIEAAQTCLARASHLQVRVAEHGDKVEPGLALLAPGDRHLRTVRRGAGYRVSISDGPLVARRRPSADVLLQSVAEAAGSAAIGVILSGAGQDGCEGATALKRSMAATFAQDEATSIATGMPSAAIARGVIDVVAPHVHLPALLLRRAAGPRGRS
jgi:two-component system, chemotaxis family, protein-glutamate methylesterase/glutaminase